MGTVKSGTLEKQGKHYFIKNDYDTGNPLPRLFFIAYIYL